MDAITLIRLAVTVVSERLMTILALGLSFGLACWVMRDPLIERIACLFIFTVYSYLLLIVKDAKHESKQKTE